MRKLIVCLSILFMCSGCASLIARPGQVIVLPEERIFTVVAGQPVKVVLDKKPMDMTFSHDMKLVSDTVLVRQEEKLNNAMLGKVKADSDKKKTVTIFGSILALLASIGGIAFSGKLKNLIPKKIVTTVESK